MSIDTSEITNWLNGIQVLPIAIALMVVIVVGLTIKFILTNLRKDDIDAQIESQVMDALTPEIADESKKDTTNKYVLKWRNYWISRVFGSGIRIPLLTKENVGSRMAIFFLSLVIIFTAITGGQIIAGICVMLIAFIVISITLGFISDKHIQKISGQVPGFLSSMRAGVQANTLPVNALKSAIKEAPEELYKELRPLEQELSGRGNLRDALMRFYNTTSIDELRFLMACIVLSVDEGSDMNEQLGIIQGVVEARQRRRRHIQHAVSEVMPTITITGAVMPGLFLYMYLADSTARQFWFHSILAWVCFILAIGIWMLGLWGVKKKVDAIKNLG